MCCEMYCKPFGLTRLRPYFSKQGFIVSACSFVALASARRRGATAVAETFKGRAQAAKPALVDGEMAIAVIVGGQLRIVLRLTIAGDGIAAVEAVTDSERIGEFEVDVLDRSSPAQPDRLRIAP